MGRQKRHKPRRPRGGNDQPTTEWFGTAFHSTEGMHHLDVRQSGNGILITSSPAEIDGAPASWALRLRNDDDGQGLNELGAALAAGRGHVQVMSEGPGHRTVLAFLPDHPEEGVGTLARVRTSEGPDGDVVFERSAERPMGLWAEAGRTSAGSSRCSVPTRRQRMSPRTASCAPAATAPSTRAPPRTPSSVPVRSR